MFKTYLKETLNYVIDNITKESKRHFNSAMSFVICAIICTLVISVVYVILGCYLFGFKQALSSGTFWESLFEDGPLNDKLWEMGGAISILCLGLYGSFVISAINDTRLDKKEAYTFKDFRQFISPEEWGAFFILMLVLMVLQLLTFTDLSILLHFDKFDGGHDQSVSQKLLHWIYKIIFIINRNLPYLFAALFIITLYEKKRNWQIIKKYKKALFASVFLGFCFNNMGAILMGYVYVFVIGLVVAITPMNNLMLTPRGIKLCIYIVIGAYYLWALSALVCLPIKMHAEQEEPVEEPDTEEADTAELPL